MSTDDDLLFREESEHVEWKESHDAKDLLDAVCAFANDLARVAWFDDHIELSNPGAPFGQAALGVLGEHSEYRNPRITQALLDLGYVERAGRGVRRARAQLSKQGHPPLEVKTNGFTQVTVRRRAP